MASTKRAKPRTAKRAATPAKKQKSTARTVKTTAAKPRAARARADKAVAAAPLLATAPKKVGKVTDAVKPTAPHQPKTDVAPIASAVAKPATPTKVKSSGAATIPAFDAFALARPWMTLGAQMTMSNIALQARIARAAIDLPPAAAAMRQGSTVYSTWLAMFGRARPAKG